MQLKFSQNQYRSVLKKKWHSKSMLAYVVYESYKQIAGPKTQKLVWKFFKTT